MSAPDQYAIGCGPNGAEPVKIPAIPAALCGDLLAVVACRSDQSDEAVVASLVTVIKLHGIADQDWEATAGKLAGQVKRVRDVIAWARTRNEELLANRDRLPTHQRAQRMSWEWSAAEVRGLADRLSAALGGQTQQPPIQAVTPGGVAIIPGHAYRDGTPVCEGNGAHSDDCDMDCVDINRWLAVQSSEGLRLISFRPHVLFTPEEVEERFNGLVPEQQNGGETS